MADGQLTMPILMEKLPELALRMNEILTNLLVCIYYTHSLYPISCALNFKAGVQWSLTYPDISYPDYSLIRTPVWETIAIPLQKVTHLSGNSVIRTVSLGTKVSE